MKAYSSPFDRMRERGNPKRSPTAFWKQIRKEWLAEWELSGETTIEWNGQSWNKSDILTQIEIWQQEPLAFHALVNEHADLNRFLQTGKTDQFTYPAMMRWVISHTEFRKELGPYFIYQLQQLVHRHITEQNFEGLAFVFRFWARLPEDWAERALEPSMRRFRFKLAQLKQDLEAWRADEDLTTRQKRFPFFDIKSEFLEWNTYPKQMNGQRAILAEVLIQYANAGQETFGTQALNAGSRWAMDLVEEIQTLKLQSEAKEWLESRMVTVPWYKSARGRWEMGKGMLKFLFFFLLYIGFMILYFSVRNSY